MGESRGIGTALPSGNKRVGLPPRAFLYTLDQIGVMLELKVSALQQSYLYFEGRSIGARRKDLMIARNISPSDKPPEWRVAEREFLRWMRTKGFRHYEVGGFSN